MSEVSNGGFLQFFDNPTGVLAPEAVQGFHRMGISELATLLDRAMKIVGHNEYPREQEARNLISLKLPVTTFKDIERELYGIGGDNLGKVHDVMDAYATKHAGS